MNSRSEPFSAAGSVLFGCTCCSCLFFARHIQTLWSLAKRERKNVKSCAVRHRHARSHIYHSSESFYFSDSVHSSDSFEWTGANTRLKSYLLAERMIRCKHTNTHRRYIHLLVLSPDPESLETSAWRFELPACSAVAPSAPYRTPESDINQKNKHPLLN